jgi:hypothetical protein
VNMVSQHGLPGWLARLMPIRLALATYHILDAPDTIILVHPNSTTISTFFHKKKAAAKTSQHKLLIRRPHLIIIKQ